uniref:Uncharacterized protein n=1 Tax=Anopheles epiroticus TaxID=199890 RepID=A0A182P159_9DIPT
MGRGKNLSNRDSVLGNRHCNLQGWRNIVCHWYGDFRHWNGGLDQLVSLQGFTADDGVESVVFIGGVVNHTAVTIGINQSVLSLNVISVAFLLLALDVSGVVIMHGVRELVLSGSFHFYFLHQRWQQDSVGNTHDGKNDEELRIQIWVGNLGDRGCVDLGDRGNDLGDRDGSFHRLTADDGVESVVLIGGVVNHTAVSISINQSVLADDVVTMALFLLALDVSGVVIVHRVLELVLGRGILVLDVLDGDRQHGSAGSSDKSEQNAVL